MDQVKVVVCKVRNVMGYPPVNVLWMTVIFKVFVSSVDCDRMRGPNEKVASVGESTDQGK